VKISRREEEGGREVSYEGINSLTSFLIWGKSLPAAAKEAAVYQPELTAVSISGEGLW